MKSLIRWSAALSLAGSIVLGSLLANSTRVLALTEEQVTERLRTVPVFTLANSEGAPLVATPTEGENQAPVAGVFISRVDAEKFLSDLKQRDPQAATDIQVVPVSLAEIYTMAQRGRDQENRLTFAFIPEEQQVQQAQTILQQSGQEAQNFEGVPLFLARTGEEGSYLTIKQGDREVIPMFFTRDELQRMLDRLKEVEPDLASSVNVQVVNLEGLIQTLQTSDNQDLNQILLVPPQASLEFVRSLQQSPQGQQNQAQPSQGQPQNQAQPAQPRQ